MIKEEKLCPCMYPIIIFDNRYGEQVEYLAIPKEIIEGKKDGIKLPDINIIEMKGKEFVSVKWNELTHDNVKDYEVNDHIVIAGCNIDMIRKESKEGTGEFKGEFKLRCDEKKIYIVLHPMDEWLDHHVIELK